MVAIERHVKLYAHPGPNHLSLIYKLHYQFYKLYEMHQPIIVTTSLILGGAVFIFSAIPNPLQQTELNSGKSYKTASRLPKLWPWFLLVAYCALRIFTTQISDKTKLTKKSSKLAKRSTAVLLQLNSFSKVYFTLPCTCKYTCIDLALATRMCYKCTTATGTCAQQQVLTTQHQVYGKTPKVIDPNFNLP